MTGFEEDLRDRILGFTPHVVWSPATGASMPDDRARLESASARVAGRRRRRPVRVRTGDAVERPRKVAGVMIRGVEPVADGADRFQPAPARWPHRGPRRDRTRCGATPAAPPCGCRASSSARSSRASSTCSPATPVDVCRRSACRPRSAWYRKVKRFVVVGLFDSGMFEYDSALVYVAWPTRSASSGSATRSAASRCAPAISTHADAVAPRSPAPLGFPYQVRDWMEMNHNLFAALKLEKLVYFIVLLLIVLVAAFNIVATLIMVVMEKRKDIAILKSMGATARGDRAHLRLQGPGHRRRRHRARQRSPGCGVLAPAPLRVLDCRRTSSTSRPCR